jgi:hypothetical protein
MKPNWLIDSDKHRQKAASPQALRAGHRER